MQIQVEKGRTLFLQVTEMDTDFTLVLTDITLAFDFLSNPVFMQNCIQENRS